MRLSVIVCAYNEENYLAPCLASVLAQERSPDEILVVNNASTDRTKDVALQFAGVRVVDEPAKGLLYARAAGQRAAAGDVLVYTDADCRAPRGWLRAIERVLETHPGAVAVSGPYSFYDWNWFGRLSTFVYNHTLAPVTHGLTQRVLGVGALLYGGNFAVRREALARIGGFDTSIEFYGEDTNLGRRLAKVGRVLMSSACGTSTSARRYTAEGTGRALRVYARNFWSEIVRHRPRDNEHEDIRR